MVCVFVALLAPALARAQNSNSHFFASRDACRGSGAFSTADCAAAFDRVAVLMRERAPHFADRMECVLRFRSCERQETYFQPAAIGVEMVKGPRGPVAIPALAVETTASMFRDPAPKPENKPEHAARPDRAASPYGDLLVDASLLAGPPTLASYRRLILASRLTSASTATRAALR